MLPSATPWCAALLSAALWCAVLLSAALLCAALPVDARARTTATLGATFRPNRLGQRTTLYFSFSFSAPVGQVPPPLTQIDLRYPAYVGFGLSGLGLATCDARTLELSGPPGCSASAVMGYGLALTGITLGATLISESAPITIVRAPNQEGHVGLLFFSEGATPVNTRIVFPGVLLPAPSPFGGLVSIGIPLVPTLPGAPYISVIRLHATLGPDGVTYYEKVGASTLAYRPRGILLPKRCPRGGFPFTARFSFQGGSEANARTAVSCPPGGHPRSGRSPRKPPAGQRH